MSAATKRVIIRLAIASAFVVLAMQAVEVLAMHRGVSIAGIIAPMVTVVSGLFYLRTARGRS